MAHPVMWAILAGVGLGVAIYYFATSGQQENRRYKERPHPGDSSWDYSGSGFSDQRERNAYSDQRQGSAKKDNICSICLNTVERDGEKTRCNHIFHLDCITKWKRMNNQTCPNCRNDL